MGYVSRVMQRLFGSEETVYNGSVIGSTDAKYLYTLQPQPVDYPDPLASNAQTMEIPQSFEIPAVKYSIVLDSVPSGRQVVDVYVRAGSKAPDFGKTIVVEKVSRLFGIPEASLQLVSAEGDRVPVLDWNVIE
jgi:hypothetical protein